MSDFIYKLKDLSTHGSDSEIKISNFLLKNRKHNISTLSAIGLGKLCSVSNASVIRFAQSLGYKGYTEFKLEYLAAQKHEIREAVYSDVHLEDSSSEVIKKAKHLFMMNVENSLKIIEPTILDQLANAIVNAEKVALFGVGSSGIAALDAFQKLIRINKNVLFSSDTHVQQNYASMLSKKDLAIAFSTEKETDETLLSLEVAQQSGCTISAITRSEVTSLTEISDFVLPFDYSEHDHSLGIVTPQLSQLMLFDTLYFRVTALMKNKTTSL